MAKQKVADQFADIRARAGVKRRYGIVGDSPAGAEARAAGKPTACAGSLAPVPAVASHIPSGETGLGCLQETHPDELFRECSHYWEPISGPRHMPRLLQTAVRHTIGRSGAGVVALPGEIADEEAVFTVDTGMCNVRAARCISPATGAHAVTPHASLCEAHRPEPRPDSGGPGFSFSLVSGG
jgi:thiamine pyrophosphate-dependent acetolactate synthase large subunit-like protein